MRDVPIFDSLTHPTADGTWINRVSAPNTLAHLLADMESNHVRWAFAVGMEGVGKYAPEGYRALFTGHEDKVFPIAWAHVDESESPDFTHSWLMRLKELGYSGIKLHPRMGRFNLRSPKLREVMRGAASVGLLNLLCCYFHGPECVTCGAALDDLPALLTEVGCDCRVVLLHGGTTRLLDVSEMTRTYPNVLLDLSFTLCRYKGSSVDLDIAWLFQNYDRRICIGSDSPQYSLSQMRQRFDHLSQGLLTEKAQNIAHRNLLNLLRTTP